MGHTELIDSLERLMPDIRRTGDPESVLLKFANDRNLAPAQLERLAQMYNTAKTITFMDKSANRGDSFSVIDAPALLARYTSPVAAPQAENNTWRDWLDEPAEKQSSHRPGNLLARARGAQELASSFDQELDAMEKLASEYHQLETDNAVLKVEIQTVGQIAFDAQENARELFGKVANFFREQGFDKFAEVDEDIQRHMGAEGLALMDTLAAFCDQKGYAVQRWTPAKQAHRLARDRHAQLATFQQIQEALTLEKCARAWIEKESAVLEKTDAKLKAEPRETRNPSPGGAIAADSKKTQKNQKEKGEGGGKKDSWIDAIDSVGGAGTNVVKDYAPSPRSVHDLAKLVLDQVGPGTNVGQQQLDSALDEDVDRTTLHRLMLTDPIISEADPDQVVNYFNTIRAHSPTVARDPNTLALTLREALQYQGVPTHSLKEVADLQMVHHKNKKEESDAAHRRYDIAASGDKRK